MVKLRGQLYHLVPALLSYLHDNPEGRDVLGLWTSNTSQQLCCLCYAELDTCSMVRLDLPHNKHICVMNDARRRMKEVQEEFPGEGR